MTTIVFMGTPEFAVPSLQQLAASNDVVGVVTQPDRPAGRGRNLLESPIKILARDLGIRVYQPVSMRSSEAVSQIKAWRPDLIVVAAYGQILPKSVLEVPVRGCLNVHASLLPRWRGASPIQHAILAGDLTTGISLMKMDAGMDTGPVYVQESLEIGQDTAAELHDRLSVLGGTVLSLFLEPIIREDLVPRIQDDSQATYAPLIKKQDGRIDWSQDSLVISRLIRAMTPWPGAFTYWRGVNFKIIAGQHYEGPTLPPGEPGNIKLVDDQVIVLAGEGAISLCQVQLAGKKVTAIEDFVRGRPDLIGATFET